MAKRIRARGYREICQPVTDLIAGYINDTLDSAVSAEFEQHVAICPDCLAFLNTYRKTLQLAQSFFERSNKDRPAWNRKRVRERIVERGKKPATRH